MKQKTKKRVGQEIIESLQEALESLRKGKTLEETFTCHYVEVPDKPTACDSQLVKNTRKMLRTTQTTFARFLGVSAQTVRAWEQGENVPSDIAKRFMDEIRHDPDYWRARLRQVIVPKKRVLASKSK
jgi:DNA-binding transcriptional regulator YiaG